MSNGLHFRPTAKHICFILRSNHDALHPIVSLGDGRRHWLIATVLPFLLNKLVCSLLDHTSRQERNSAEADLELLAAPVGMVSLPLRAPDMVKHPTCWGVCIVVVYAPAHAYIARRAPATTSLFFSRC